MIGPGASAPDFELPDQDGEPVRLSSLRGRTVVVHLYPKAATRVLRRTLQDVVVAVVSQHDRVAFPVEGQPISSIEASLVYTGTPLHPMRAKLRMPPIRA